MNIIKIKLLLFLLIAASVHSTESRYQQLQAEDLTYAENLVGSFIDEMNAYSRGYDWARRLYLVDYIFLNGPETDVAWDIPGTDFNESSLVVRTYLRRIKELNIQIEYSTDFKVTSCNTQFGNLLGAIVTKKIKLATGESYDFIEFLELSGTSKSNTKIRSITSSKYQSLSTFDCLQPSDQSTAVEEIKKEDRCVLFEEAEEAYKDNQYSEALSLYRKSKSCAKDISYVNTRIDELSTLERRQSLVVQANKAYDEGRYNEAISLYQTYLDSGNNNDVFADRGEITKKIEAAKSEIAFVELQEQAEYYMSKQYYQQAIVAYRDALQLKPGNSNLLSQIAFAEEKQRSLQANTIKQEIAEATRWLSVSRKQGDGLVTLMKYEDSGLLNAQQFISMAYVLDANFRPAKKAFDLSNKDCCILAKRFAIKASQLGISKDEYDYLWNDHYNKRSRSCN